MSRGEDRAGGRTFVAVDVETSGLSPRRGARVIEIGAVLVEGSAVAGEFSSLMASTTRVSCGARRVHGIGAGDLRSAPSPSVVIPAFRDFVGQRPLVAHNAAFDVAFLRREYAAEGLEFRHPYSCSLSLARRLLPGLRSRRLVSLYTYLLGPLPEGITPHRALGDARLVAGVWVELLRRLAAAGGPSYRL